MPGTLTVVYGLPGSGKTHLIRHVLAADIRAEQSGPTQRLADAIAFCEPLLARGLSVAVEPWGWRYPADRPYRVVEIYFELNVRECVRNVIRDGVTGPPRPWSGVRMDALLSGAGIYRPAGPTLPVYRAPFDAAMADRFFRRFPGRDEAAVRAYL